MELAEVFVAADLVIDLDVTYPDRAAAVPGSAGRFVVRGPKHVLHTLSHVVQGSDDEGTHGKIEGVISPICPVTLPEEIKKEAGIPAAATAFAFINPLTCFRRRLNRINLATELWGFVFLLGGFAYFDENGVIVGINALSIVPSEHALHLVGPHTGTEQAGQAMTKLGRMADVVVDGLTDAGFVKFGWVHPGELPGGCTISDHTSNEHGGFLYERANGSTAFFTVSPPVGEEDMDKYNLDGTISSALIGLQQLLIEGDRAMRKTLGWEKHRTERLRVTTTAIVAFAMYIAIGCGVMCTAEHWNIIDGFYFCMVTMSTVGYGDLSPTTGATQAFSLVLILVGIIFIFAKIAAAVSLWTSPHIEQARHKVNVWFPSGDQKKTSQPKIRMPCGEERRPSIFGHASFAAPTVFKGIQKVQKGARGGAKVATKARSAAVFYFKNMLPSIFLNLLLQFVSAAIFVAIDAFEDEGRSSLTTYFFVALYHCLVTASTVGYGDIPIVEKDGVRLWVSIHILLSVSLLGEAIHTFDVLRKERERELMRFEALNHKLDQTLLQNLNMRAAALRPDVQRDAEGLSELEFVIGTSTPPGYLPYPSLHPFLFTPHPSYLHHKQTFSSTSNHIAPQRHTVPSPPVTCPAQPVLHITLPHTAPCLPIPV